MSGSAVIFLLDVIVVFLIASTLFESYAEDQFREEMAIYADQLTEELRYDARGQPGLKLIPPTTAFIDEKAEVL